MEGLPKTTSCVDKTSILKQDKTKVNKQPPNGTDINSTGAVLKLYSKPAKKSNLMLHNALHKALEGAANAKTLTKMLETIAKHTDCTHFLILFKSHQFRGLYDYDEKLNTITKLDGIGPKIIKSSDIFEHYKYDSTRREFTIVETKTISPTIVGLSLDNNFWKKTFKPV